MRQAVLEGILLGFGQKLPSEESERPETDDDEDEDEPETIQKPGKRRAA